MPAKSKSQQRLMGMVHAYKKGELKVSDLPKGVAKKVKNVSKSMTAKEAKKYASTKRKSLPKQVKESMLSNKTTFKQFINAEDQLVDAFSELTEEQLETLEDKVFEAVSRLSASKVYHRDYMRTRDKPYRKYDPAKRRRLKGRVHVKEDMGMSLSMGGFEDEAKAALVDDYLRKDMHLMKVMHRETHPSEVEVHRGVYKDTVRMFYPVREIKNVFAAYREMFGEPVDRTNKDNGGVIVSHFHDNLTNTPVDLYWNRNQGYLMGTFPLHAHKAGVRDDVAMENYYLDAILQKIELING